MGVKSSGLRDTFIWFFYKRGRIKHDCKSYFYICFVLPGWVTTFSNCKKKKKSETTLVMIWSGIMVTSWLAQPPHSSNFTLCMSAHAYVDFHRALWLPSIFHKRACWVLNYPSASMCAYQSSPTHP